MTTGAARGRRLLIAGAGRRIMTDDPVRRDTDAADHVDRDSGGSGVVFAIVAIALILAIIFFYLTSDARDDRRSEAVTKAAGTLDDAARHVGDAAREAADGLRDKGDKNRVRLNLIRAD